MKLHVTNSRRDSVDWDGVDWWRLLNLARRYGWQPSAADSDYFTHGRSIAAPDAAALAGALESFFNDVCRDEIAGEVAERMQDVLDGKTGQPNAQRFEIFTEPIELIRSLSPKIPTYTLSDEGFARLQFLVILCRSGAFSIR